jgi:hypothetical protein
MNQFLKIKKYANERHGDVLDCDFISPSHSMTFVDAKGRVFRQTWKRMSGNQSWSPFEALEKKRSAGKKYTITDLQNYAQSKNGKLISTEYKLPSDIYEWEDADGNRFFKTWKYVRKSWGVDRRGKHFAHWTLPQVIEWCESKGGAFLSPTYNHMEGIYKFRDRNGKEFFQSFRTCLYNNDLLYVERSRGEAEIADFLISVNIPFETKVTHLLDNSSKEIDLWIPSLNIGIEYHGLYWHTTESSTTPVAKKQELASIKGINLIQILENEWKERKSQVKSFLLSKLGKNSIKIGARKCQLRIVPKSEAREFFDLYHIQGYANCKIALGLYFNNELVCAALFGNHHRSSEKLVLSRFVGKTDVSVSGGLSRICKEAFKMLGQFHTWVDLRWSNGSSWLNCGWKFEQQLPPDYFYLDPKSNKVISKQSRKKANVGTLEGMTEKEHAKLDGLKIIKDAGKIRMVYNR